MELAGFEIINKIGYGKLVKLHDFYQTLLSEGMQMGCSQEF